ncbi:MAG: prolipoprotein diacylglyceryl transferase [Alphaproteobacteria bacterium]|nr:prolipoprotein diacylglyceryl transferase [Alphaproteobacteria bacterium]
MTFPDISPIAFEMGPLVIRWYALAYVVGILLAQRYILRLDARHTPALLSARARDDMVLYAVFGIILGGRLGYVLFYNFSYYIDNIPEVLHIWQGGMSFHGGALGVALAFTLFARRFKINLLKIMDLLAVATPVGLFFGRLANFVNGELYGRVTTLPWGMVFPRGGPLPRHPSQLYEAGLEGLALGVLLWLLATRSDAMKRPGILSGVFIAGYGLARFTVEFFREPDAQLGTLTLGLSMGQWLSVPMLLVGGALALRGMRKEGKKIA